MIRVKPLQHRLDRRGWRSGFDLLQTPFLEIDLVVVIHIVQRSNRTGGAVTEKPYNKICLDKPWGSGDKNGVPSRRNGFFAVLIRLAVKQVLKRPVRVY